MSIKEDGYVIASLRDLFAVPADLRAAFLRQIADAVDSAELAAVDAVPAEFRVTWRHRGDKSIDITVNGEAIRYLIKAPLRSCSCLTCQPIAFQMVRCSSCRSSSCQRTRDHRNKCSAEVA